MFLCLCECLVPCFYLLLFVGLLVLWEGRARKANARQKERMEKEGGGSDEKRRAQERREMGGDHQKMKGDTEGNSGKEERTNQTRSEDTG